MRAGTLPPALLCAALGLALAFVPRRDALIAVGAMVIVAILVRLLHPPSPWEEAIFLGLWASVAATAVSVYLRRFLRPGWAVFAGVNAGLWTGAVTAVAGSPRDLALALPVVLILVPARWLARWEGGVVVKAAASWLLAVAVLSAMLPLTPTPGYKPDHME